MEPIEIEEAGTDSAPEREYEVRYSPRAGIECRVMTVAEAEADGTELELLFALRKQCAEQLSQRPSPRDFAAISRRMIELGRDIEAAEELEAENGEAVGFVANEPFDPDAI